MFLNMTVEAKLFLWRELNEVGDPRIRWLEQFIPEERLRDERAKGDAGRFHSRGETPPGLWDEEGNPDEAEAGKAAPFHFPGVESPSLFDPESREVAPGK
jgi:hypothetical protein